jgi:uncharacterized protein YbaP (TraB family)
VTSTTGTLYLQGSIHALTAESYPLAPAIEQAYVNSDTLVLEVDMKEMSTTETQQRIMPKALLPASTTLKDLLSPITYQQLDTTCADIGLPIAALERFKPWFAATALTLMKLQNMGFDPQYGLDQYFHDKAVADTKPVIGLESVDFQIDLFDSLSESNPDNFVAHTLADLAVIDSEMKTMEAVWETGKIDALGEFITEGFEGYPKLYKTFVTDRNARWLDTLGSLLGETKTHMVVIGSGHLPGKEGLLELLKQKGYALEQL